MFVTVSHFHPSLPFASIATALGTPLTVRTGSEPCLQILDQGGSYKQLKHCRLLLLSIYYGRKRFYNTEPRTFSELMESWTNGTKRFSASLEFPENKLECFSVSRIFSQVQYLAGAYKSGSTIRFVHERHLGNV